MFDLLNAWERPNYKEIIGERPMYEHKTESVVWQRCPICEGKGKIAADGFTSAVYQQCPCCDGKRIISILTGLPPA